MELASAAAAWDAGDWRGAHEAFEALWRRGVPPASGWKALAQLAAAELHRTRGNDHGARTLGRRAAGGLGAEWPRLAEHARALANRGLAAGPAPPFPREPGPPGVSP